MYVYAAPCHNMECILVFSMEVKGAIAWNCNIVNSMEFHAIARLTFTKCTQVDSMEGFHVIARLTKKSNWFNN